VTGDTIWLNKWTLWHEFNSNNSRVELNDTGHK
jgi:hypothetical protein